MENEPRELTYLAGPYWSEVERIREERFDAHLEAANWLFQRGVWCYAPVVYGHVVNEWLQLRPPNNDWTEFSMSFIPVCNSLTVLQMDGTEESRGVSLEIEKFQALELPTFMMFYVSGNWRRVLTVIHQV